MGFLITDVTEMGGETYCVAGWNTTSGRMLRPLPGGSNWSSALVEQHGIVPGRVIRAAPKGVPNGVFPHRTEDTPIDPASIESSGELFSDWVGQSAPQVVTGLENGFEGHLRWNKVWNGVRQGVHTLPGARCRSLVAVRIPTANLGFSEVFGKLKAVLNDGYAGFQLTVSSRVLKEAWRTGGLAAISNALPARQEVHVRIGLARPFGDPQKCYAMLNGAL
jgi:hypothetical protein